VSNNLKPEEIVLEFSAQQAEYIKSQPLHHTQKVILEDTKSCKVSIVVIPSFELKAQLLSYGSSLIIISPEWMKKELKIELEKALAQY
jgi:predicted DNA-binding transcriptional regulator YafY